ncbi:MAG TPA: alkaline phosphatase [Lachnospiraceae bacterium]|nr:alkaline phosphatase [Lachnospiraceae bacterium]
MKKKLALITLTAVVGAAAFTAIGTAPRTVEAETTQVSQQTAADAADRKEKLPKYIFLFIGDGMSYPQIQLTNYYLSAQNQQGARTVQAGDEKKTELTSKNNLVMMDFPVSGSAQTYDSTSFAPDSASTATAIATGNKTWSGSINVSLDFSKEYETIAEKLKKQKGYKIGILSTVNLNHATPAAFYAHQESRNNYYEIGQELIDSGFDYFAGGGLKKVTGSEENKENLYDLARKAGYKVVMKQDEVGKLKKDDSKVIIIDEHLADSDAMSYEVDRTKNDYALADYVSKGIDLLNNDKGFFMMVEGGKIDWACHANDGASTIGDTLALDNAVAEAVKFYNQHPDETLILVTGDHETGGLTIGYAGTDYDTFLKNFKNQKISYAKFDEEYVAKYKENKTSFNDAMKDVTSLFGLTAPDGSAQAGNGKDSADLHPESEDDGTLAMTQYEYDKLKKAYEVTMSRTGEETEFSQEEYVAYGSYEPFTVTITHILNNKSGVNFGSYAHTGLPVEVLAQGAGQNEFTGYYDNTEIYDKMAELTGVQ